MTQVWPIAVHHLKDGPEGGCAPSAQGCVLYFDDEQRCVQFMEWLGRIANMLTTSNAPMDSEAERILYRNLWDLYI